MFKLNFAGSPKTELAKSETQPVGRRNFLRYAGVTAASSAIVLVGCKDNDPPMAVLSGVDLGPVIPVF